MAFSRKRLKQELLSAQEVAELLDVKPGTVRAFHARGQIVEPLVVLGSGPIWLRTDVERWRRTRPLASR